MLLITSKGKKRHYQAAEMLSALVRGNMVTVIV